MVAAWRPPRRHLQWDHGIWRRQYEQFPDRVVFRWAYSPRLAANGCHARSLRSFRGRRTSFCLRPQRLEQVRDVQCDTWPGGFNFPRGRRRGGAMDGCAWPNVSHSDKNVCGRFMGRRERRRDHDKLLPGEQEQRQRAPAIFPGAIPAVTRRSNWLPPSVPPRLTPLWWRPLCFVSGFRTASLDLSQCMAQRLDFPFVRGLLHFCQLERFENLLHLTEHLVEVQKTADERE